jgi:hypothetical protein
MPNWYMLIKGVGKNENSEKGLFVWTMPHERQGVWDPFNYTLHFTSGNIQIFQMTFFFVERENFNYKKDYYPA